MTYNQRITQELNRRFGLSDRRRVIASMRLDDARALRRVNYALAALGGGILTCVLLLIFRG